MDNQTLFYVVDNLTEDECHDLAKAIIDVMKTFKVDKYEIRFGTSLTHDIILGS